MNHLTRSRQGFTLFELLVVLMVVSLMSAMVIPRLSGYLNTIELKSAARRVAAVLRHAGNKAATEKRFFTAEIDFETRQLRLYVSSELRSFSIKNNETPDGDNRTIEAVYPLPEGIRFTAGEENENASKDPKTTIVFFPNGSCTGGAIALSNEKGKQFNLTIDSITGSVSISN